MLRPKLMLRPKRKNAASVDLCSIDSFQHQSSDMGLLQLFIDAQLASIALAAARRKGCVTFNLSKYPRTEQGRLLVENYLLFGEKVIDFFNLGISKIPKKK